MLLFSKYIARGQRNATSVKFKGRYNTKWSDSIYFNTLSCIYYRYKMYMYMYVQKYLYFLHSTWYHFRCRFLSSVLFFILQKWTVATMHVQKWTKSYRPSLNWLWSYIVHVFFITHCTCTVHLYNQIQLFLLSLHLKGINVDHLIYN